MLHPTEAEGQRVNSLLLFPIPQVLQSFWYHLLRQNQHIFELNERATVLVVVEYLFLHIFFVLRTLLFFSKIKFVMCLSFLSNNNDSILFSR